MNMSTDTAGTTEAIEVSGRTASTDLLRLALEGTRPQEAASPAIAGETPSLPARLLFARTSAPGVAISQGYRVSYAPFAALLLSAASAWAYSDQEALNTMLRTTAMVDAQSQPFGVVNGALLVDAQAFFVRSEQNRVGILVFRGTEFGGVTLTDIFTDINTETVEYPDAAGSSVHGGFYRSFKYLWPQLVPALRDAADAIDHLFITGHSLGGALAVFATCELVDGAMLPERLTLSDGLRSKLQGKFRGLYTFGQPMVGDQKFAARFNTLIGSITFRHVYQYDVVPRLPPRTTGRFAHFGREFFGTSTQPWRERDVPIQQVFAATLSIPVGILASAVRQLPAGRRLSLPVSLSDHMPQNYVDCSKLRNAATTYP